MYRIQQGQVWYGFTPITVWYVQVKRETRFGYEWINIKGYGSYDKAKRLLYILNGKEKL